MHHVVHGVPALPSLCDFGHVEVLYPFSNTVYQQQQQQQVVAAAVVAAAAAAEMAKSSQLNSSFAGQAVQYFVAGGKASPS
jgi:hypothetical protein